MALFMAFLLSGSLIYWLPSLSQMSPSVWKVRHHWALTSISSVLSGSAGGQLCSMLLDKLRWAPCYQRGSGSAPPGFILCARLGNSSHH